MFYTVLDTAYLFLTVLEASNIEYLTFTPNSTDLLPWGELITKEQYLM